MTIRVTKCAVCKGMFANVSFFALDVSPCFVDDMQYIFVQGPLLYFCALKPVENCK